MSNTELATQSAASELCTMVWTTKAGKGMQAASATLQALAPLAVRKADATNRDLQSLRNGRYDRVLADIKDNLNAKDIKALFMLGVGTPVSGAGKEAAIAFLRSVGAIWGTTKGKRGALADTINQFVKECDMKARREAELAEFKKMLEAGCITQEEFDACTAQTA